MEAHKRHRAAFNAFAVPYDAGPPLIHPPLPLDRSAQGCTFYAFPITGSPPDSHVFRQLGFELSLAYTTRHSRASGWEELQRLVAKHDQPGVDELVITAGGTDARGYGFLSEEVLLDFLLEEPVDIAPPQSIATVLAHFWSSGPPPHIVTREQTGTGVSVLDESIAAVERELGYQ